MNNRAPAKRAYNRSLRSRQAEQTRELIAKVGADLIAEEGLQALSIAEIARRAGVSLRTVWRNFASLDDLIDEVERLSALAGPPLLPPLDAFDEHVQKQFAYFEEHAAMILSTLYWRFSQAEAPPARADRLQNIINVLDEATPGLSPELRRVGAAAMALLPSGMSWATLRKEFDWSPKEAGQAVGWIVQLVIDELMRLSDGEQPRSRPRIRADPRNTPGREGVASVAQDPN
jgi:AcrR family transcriptional regulator